MEQVQSKVVTLRVSNLKFSVNKRKTSGQFHSLNQSCTHYSQKTNKNTGKSASLMVLQGFIPKNIIKISNKSISNDKKVNTSLLNLSETNHSKFPYRKPKSIKINNFISIFRRKLKMNAEHNEKGEEDFSLNIFNRARTNFSNDKDQNQPQYRTFKPYSKSNMKTQYVYRQQGLDSNFQEVGRIYL